MRHDLRHVSEYSESGDDVSPASQQAAVVTVLITSRLAMLGAMAAPGHALAEYDMIMYLPALRL